LSESRIVANQSHLARGIKSNNIQIKLYVKDQAHYSGYSTRELAKMHSEGFSINVRRPNGKTRIIDVPARPFMREFFEANKQELAHTIGERVTTALLTSDNLDPLVESLQDYVLSMFQLWAHSGGITPPNAPFTIKRKGSENALIDKGFLLAAVDTEGHVVTTKQ